MKKTLMILTVALSSVCAQATLQPILNYSQTFNSGASVGTIADGNQVGQSFTGQFTAANSWDQVVAAAVTLNISGGYNGDLYAYLVAPNGTLTMLLNQSGNLTGSGLTSVTLTSLVMDGSQIQVNGAPGGAQTFTASTEGNIQSANDSGSALTGTYQPMDSLLYQSISSAQNTGPTGPNANGTWTLFFADMTPDEGGNGNHTLTSWTLDLAVVPEPVDMALGLFAAMLLALAGIKRFWTVKEAKLES